MSEFVCVLPFSDGDTRMTQRFILVWAKEGPMSSGRATLYYLASKCLYRGECKRMWPRVLSHSRWWCVRTVFYELYLLSQMSSSVSPFIVPRGDLGYRV